MKYSYVNTNHLVLRFEQSAIRVKNYPDKLFYVQDVEPPIYLKGVFYPGRLQTKIDFRAVDTRMIPLGYVKLDRCYYISRKPARRNKFGLCRDNIDIHSFQYLKLRFERFIEGLVQPLKNSYYKLDTIFDLKSRDDLTWMDSPVFPFNRYFALNPTTEKLFYKTYPIGFLTKRKQPQLFPETQCLKELLEEAIHEAT